MAGAMRKMAVYLGLVEEDDRYDEYDHYADEGYVEAPRVPREARHMAAVRDDAPRDLHEAPRGATLAAVPPRQASPVAHAAPIAPAIDRITTIHPRTYNEAKLIGESFRDGTPVIMNLTDMDDSDAKRLVDFAAGLVFGLRGSIERVTNKVFLLSPANVEVTAEDKARMVERGFFNQS
ncbi:MAG: cell division protein SepF [Actinomycetales bacterium]